jgi:uncharacterized paraquat-inducible protein A
MATTKYRCTDYGGCDKALQHEVIEIEVGEEALCPECKNKLQLLIPPSRSGLTRWIYAAVATVLLALGVSLWLVHSSPKPDPVDADKMLSEFYPQLPAK